MATGLPSAFNTLPPRCALSQRTHALRELREAPPPEAVSALAQALAERMLRSAGWHITSKTSVEEIEHLIVLLVKCLDTWTSKVLLHGELCTWCVGGSLAATINSRDAETGNSSTLRFVACSRADWVRHVHACLPPS